MRYVFYCKNCNKVHILEDAIFCPDCFTKLTPFGLSEDDWSILSEQQQEEMIKDVNNGGKPINPINTQHKNVEDSEKIKKRISKVLEIISIIFLTTCTLLYFKGKTDEEQKKTERSALKFVYSATGRKLYELDGLYELRYDGIYEVTENGSWKVLP